MNKNYDDYVKQFPKEENPYNWFMMVPFEEIDDFVRKRNGRKVLLRIDSTKTDSGELYYEPAK